MSNANSSGILTGSHYLDGDHAAARFTWEILVQCGDPSIATVGARFSPETTRAYDVCFGTIGWFLARSLKKPSALSKFCELPPIASLTATAPT